MGKIYDITVNILTIEKRVETGFHSLLQCIFPIKNSPGCLGFAPRSESFAIEPSVQVCSISSLSEFRFAQYVRKSAGL